MYCPNCGVPGRENARFCHECGAELIPPQPPVFREPIPQQPVSQEAALQPFVPQEPEAPAAPEKKGSHWVPILILAVLSLLGLLVFFATAGKTGTSSATPWFTVVDGTLYFDESRYTGPEELTVPETVGSQTVTALADSCFSGCGGITTVILPDTVTEIGSAAFSGCTALRGIYLPDGVTEIGIFAFNGCTALEAVRVPGSVEEIGMGALFGCDALRYILFDGNHADWEALGCESGNSIALVYCDDGVFPME